MMKSASEVHAVDAVAPARERESLRRRVVQVVWGRLLKRAESRLVAAGSLPAFGIHRILICRPNHRLGNMLLLTPLVRALETAYPCAEVDLLVGSGIGEEVFAGFARVRNVFSLGARMARHPLRIMSMLRRLRRTNYDLVIDAGRGSQSGRIFAAMVGGRRLLGVPENQDGDASGLHFSHRPVAALAAALADRRCLTPPYPALDIQVSEAERLIARSILSQLLRGRDVASEPVVGVFANATGAKLLDKAWWNRFIDRVQEQRPGLAMIEVLPAHGRSMLDCRLPTYFSTDIRAMGALASQLSAFVSADCGVMHLASAAGVATIGLFSRTDHRLYGPFDNGSCALRTDEVSPEQVAETLLCSLPDVSRSPAEKVPAQA
jgi:ADP-heptose:LPS heptosyltransferase